MVYLLDSVLALLPNVVETVDLAPNLNTFSRALNVSGVGAALGAATCPDPVNATCNVTGVTVLAPTDAAFQSLARSQNMTVDQLLALPQARRPRLSVYYLFMCVCVAAAARGRGRCPAGSTEMLPSGRAGRPRVLCCSANAATPFP